MPYAGTPRPHAGQGTPVAPRGFQDRAHVVRADGSRLLRGLRRQPGLQESLNARHLDKAQRAREGRFRLNPRCGVREHQPLKAGALSARVLDNLPGPSPQRSGLVAGR